MGQRKKQAAPNEPRHLYREDVDDQLAKHRAECTEKDCKDNITLTKYARTENDYGLIAAVNKSRPSEIVLQNLPIKGGKPVLVLHLAEPLPPENFVCAITGTDNKGMDIHLVPICHHNGVALANVPDKGVILVCALGTCHNPVGGLYRLASRPKAEYPFIFCPTHGVERSYLFCDHAVNGSADGHVLLTRADDTNPGMILCEACNTFITNPPDGKTPNDAIHVVCETGANHMLKGTLEQLLTETEAALVN